MTASLDGVDRLVDAIQSIGTWPLFAVGEKSSTPLWPSIAAATVGAFFAAGLAHLLTLYREDRRDRRELARSARREYLTALDRVVLAATENGRLVDMAASNAGRRSFNDVYAQLQAHLVEWSGALVSLRVRAGTDDPIYRAFRECGVLAASFSERSAEHASGEASGGLAIRRLQQWSEKYGEQFRIAVELMDETLAPGNGETDATKVDFRGTHDGR